MPHIYLWLGSLTFILTAAFAYGWFLYEELSHWAFINKLLGWFVLLAIMGLGAWIGTNARRVQIELFLKIFLCCILVILIHEISILVAQSFTFFQTWIPHNEYISFPISGFMWNRNAYAFLLVAAIAISTCFYFSNKPILKPLYSYILFFLLPFFVIFNASRAAWFALAATLIVMFFLNRHQTVKAGKLILCALIGTVLFLSIFWEKKQEVNFITPRMIEVFEGGPETHKGDIMRLNIINMAIPMIQKNPIFGSGLGSAMMEQKRETGEIINLIDNTGLWLWVETGLVGLLFFAAFYIALARYLFKSLKEDDEFAKTIRQSILYIILGFTVMCLFHELLYTRFIWFFLGLSLALPARMLQDG